MLGRNALLVWFTLGAFQAVLWFGWGERAWGALPTGAGLNPPMRVIVQTNLISSAPTGEEVKPSNSVELRLAHTGRTFTWRDVTLPEYTNYLANLRAVGCPEERVRQIIICDVNQYFDEQRLEAGTRLDIEWWKPGGSLQTLVLMPAQCMARLERQRVATLERLLGTNAAETVKLPDPGHRTGPTLTGPVLCAMALDRYSAAAAICLRARERLEFYWAQRHDESLPPDPAEEARLREETRKELGRLFTPQEMEEFLLRNAHNADALRESLRGFVATPEEFRKIFRALDALQQQVQVDYGGPDALSANQREEFDRQCDGAVRELLPPERFQAYLLTKQPGYRRAVMEAAQLGLPDTAAGRLHEIRRDCEKKRQQIMQDAALKEDQRTQAIEALAQEEQKLKQDLTAKKP